ncbi:uncharacterized protein PFL1_05168 [Pseudozyma flocculosa PF-1]|uniref:Uncharacterized protein n=1 Tax=Pseudozyma flocculosa PF-1 TaxID=1277687 RepID=A0A061H5H6_9BASI|nr:uncharacterized protein PFL1_05168 [Pseudozyma flocculosa PF-1]EPQ27245.1 hypothetical protein PFL1_05168 [Pseudozyma flocculosa PF-1]
MQSPAPAAGSGPASALALSPIERSAFAHLFNLADPDRTGIVTGDAAVSFFAKSKLPPATLGQIWAIADSANNGFLTPPSFSTALRLIGHAQRGETVTEALAKRPGPPPTLEGITLPLSAQLTGGAPAAGAAAAAPPPNMPGVIEIKPEDRARYTRIFASSGPQGGLIDGEKAKEIFVKSKLPFDKLGAIWNLADTQARGALDLTDFIIGMHFIQNTMNGSLNSIPAALPPGLYEQAKGSASRIGGGGFSGVPLAAQMTGGSASGAIPRQFTGQPPLSGSASRTFSPAPHPPAAAAAGMSAFQSPQTTGVDASRWDVTPEEKLRSDRFFDGLDVEKKGELEGAAVVPFFMQSKLTEASLAHIWDLSDVTQTGTLSKDEFAVAMHLINQQLAGKELPQELPQTLIPPSMRTMSLPQAVNPQQTDTQKDLFSLMDDDPPPPAVPATSAFIAPSSNAPTVANVAAGTAGAAASTTQPASASGPFDDDFFGGASSTPSQAPAAGAATALSPTATGGSFGGGAAGVRSPSLQTPGTPSRGAGGLGDQSAEFGNKSIQLQSTQKAVADLQAKRSGLETAVTTNAASLAELETRLSTVRSQHESESKLVKDLEARRNAQSEELRKLREDVIREESGLSALKAEKDELEQAVMHDREDVRDMKKKMGEIQVETKALKETLEKLRKDARQQKGLVAISKKQLGTAEADREKVQADIAAAERGEGLAEEAATPAAVGNARDLASPRSIASPALPAESALSPAASVRSTNPFDRFGPAGAGSSRPESPAMSMSQPAHSGLDAGTAALAGAGAGAALGGAAAVGMAATSSDGGKGKDDDPFAVQRSAGEQQASATGAPGGFDDAFGVPNDPATATATAPAAGAAAHADFDDNFGDDFGASAAPAATTASGTTIPATTTAFDDAFGDNFDGNDAAKAGPQAGGEAKAGDAPGASAASTSDGFGSSFAPASTIATPGGAAPEPEHAPQSDEEDHQQAPGGHHGGAEDDSSDDDSSDDEDGPEDVGGYKQPTAGVGATPMTDTTDASERFPEVSATGTDDDADGESPFGRDDAAPATAAGDEASPSIPGGFGAFGEAAEEPTAAGKERSASTSAPVDSSAVGAGETASVASIAPVSRQETGAGDEGETVGADQQSSSLSTGLGAGVGAGAGAAVLTGLGAGATVAATGSGEAPPLSPSAEDDDVPLGQILSKRAAATGPTGADATSTASQPSLSPSSSIKTPAPAAATAANSASNTNSGSSNFDDFDSAFEDLGQAEVVPSSSAGAGGTAAAATGAPMAGFDDAFDNDFDFVPSFATGAGGSTAARGASDPFFPAAAGAASSSSSAAAAPAAASNAGFEDFDSAFDPIAGTDTSTSATASKAAGEGSQANSGSGFSFEDAFAPAASSSSTGGAAASAAAVAPTTTTYAPPPGPPPPSLPERKSTTTTTTTTAAASQAVNALPDDAGPVKQLCGMGFERPKVIEALEKSNYRTEKALERLLAQA